jgi:predicted lysophospholipase L1 biosynthesis ABC-type transport system permease subunit
MLGFYSTLFVRQLRQPSIRLFCIALTVACTVTFSISMLGDRIEKLLNMQAKEVLAADLVLESSSQFTDQQVSIIQ